jgi:hypothetical protein
MGNVDCFMANVACFVGNDARFMVNDACFVGNVPPFGVNGYSERAKVGFKVFRVAKWGKLVFCG